MKSIMSQAKKKGQLGGLTGSVIALVVAIIVLVMGLVIIQEIRDTDIVSSGVAVNDTAFNSANISLAGLGDFADFIPIIVIAVAASVIIGLILVGFAFTSRQR
jgi:hypothetical protein